jgi:Sulfotransferase family
MDVTPARRLPTFLCIGAQKAGTTWLYRNLAAHPDIWMPPVKELHAFDERFGSRHSLRQRLFGDEPRDERWRRQIRRRWADRRDGRDTKGVLWDLRYFFVPPSIEWYRALFEPARGRIAGEITPEYSALDLDAVRLVSRVNPDLRVVLLVRNPVERAWSHAQMRYRNDSRFRDERRATQAFIDHFESDRSYAHSDYLKTIDTWTAVFSQDQVFVGFLEDVHRHPRALLKHVCAHIGAEPHGRFPTARRRVHSGAADGIPLIYAQHLATMYRDLVDEFDRRYGGYGSWWRFALQRLIDNPPAGRVIHYPFFESSLWTDWLDTIAPDERARPGVERMQSTAVSNLARAPIS